MAIQTLTPAASSSAIALPETGALATAAISTNYPYGMYVSGDLSDDNFVTGATEQVNYTFRKLGGDILDIELTEKNIFAAYEEAVLEYSYLVNIHQTKRYHRHNRCREFYKNDRTSRIEKFRGKLEIYC